MCIFDNPLFYLQFVAYLTKKSKRNLNALLTHTRNTEKNNIFKAKSLQVILVEFSWFLRNVED